MIAGKSTLRLLPDGVQVIASDGVFDDDKAEIRDPLVRGCAFASSAKAVVVMVTVGMPDFSMFRWSTTSHVVQLPQSA